ncbi:hypothetical protein R3P38DRAFT_2882176 [Favolaschia claudopus]|uniref:BTB domain-containing protein n=1 Tax=Favolaschia claudopus TaxID=2862362 RepID=A0AAW0CYI5_9AGAR
MSASAKDSSSSGLWFKDGTLVLRAGGSSFRIYGGFLADRSPAFRDILGLPESKDAPQIDGCPVVELSDGENDLRCFLKALFDYDFFPPYPAKTDFATLSGIIRLSTKYRVESLRQRALAHLSSAFPSDPTEFSPGSASWSLEGPEWLRVILFAREMSLDWIIPLAFYRVCAFCTPAQILNGVDVVSHNPNHSTADDTDSNTTHIELNPADKLMCIQQSISLGKSASADILNFLWEPASIPSCQRSSGSGGGGLTPDNASQLSGRNNNWGASDNGSLRSPTLDGVTGKWRCTQARFMLRKEAEAWRSSSSSNNSGSGSFPLTLFTPADFAQLERDVCAGCMAAMRTAHQHALDTFWDGLPRRFGLPGWKELEEIKESVLEGPH